MRNARRTLCALVAAALLAALPATANASQHQFLKLDGISGESQASGHEGQLDLQSWSWGLSRSKEKPSFQDFHFVHSVDSASPAILNAVANGQTISFATLHVETESASPVEYLRLCFTGVQMTSMQTGGSSGSGIRPLDQVSFAYQTVVERYTPQDSTGTPGDPIFGGWDLVKKLQFGDANTC